MKFEIHPSNSRAQPFYWRIVASNGKILASSETYVRKADAIAAAQSVIKQAAKADIEDQTT